MKFSLLPLDDDVDNDKKVERKKINKGDTARVMYKLYLHPMAKTDRRRHIYSQANLNRAFDVVLGNGRVIKGFDEAIYQMKVGDKGRFVLPPHIGYGSNGQAGFQIPGGATLIYYLELVGHTPRSELYRAHSGASDSFKRQYD
jgi:FKBP-type peptidyl-prolyl cis-trans isomerase